MLIRELFGKFIARLRSDGLWPACKGFLSWALFKVKAAVGCEDQIQKRRLFLSRRIDESFGSTVKYGPFKGLKLSVVSWWGATDRAGMLLGLYEQEVLSALQAVPQKYRKSFIDLGAADGYYGVGVLVSGLFERSFCFEINEKGQRAIETNATLNGVASRLEVFGAAGRDFYTQLPESASHDSVLLVDIEGAEFEILTADTFKHFSNAMIIIELHDHFFPDGDQRLERLRQMISGVFEIEELTTTKRDLSVFPELKQFSDTDRWLICSEGRRALPHWYVLKPAVPH